MLHSILFIPPSSPLHPPSQSLATRLEPHLGCPGVLLTGLTAWTHAALGLLRGEKAAEPVPQEVEELCVRMLTQRGTEDGSLPWEG